MSTPAPDLGDLLRQYVWGYFGEHHAWPAAKDVVVYLDDRGIEL